MLGIFRKKSKAEKLQKKYRQLLQQAHALSTTNRTESDKKYAEAQAILEELEQIQKD